MNTICKITLATTVASTVSARAAGPFARISGHIMDQVEGIANTVDNATWIYERSCQAADFATMLPWSDNVTEMALDAIDDMSPDAEVVYGLAFRLMGTTEEECIDNDCLNPCYDEVSSCLKCFTGILRTQNLVDDCGSCHM